MTAPVHGASGPPATPGPGFGPGPGPGPGEASPGFGREQCLALLASVQVGRLVYTRWAMPAVAPLLYVLLRGCLYVRTGEQAGLSTARAGVVVAFEVDAFDDAAHAGWSVVVVGTAEAEDDPVVLAELLRLPLPQWVDSRHDRVVRIPVDLVSGRSLDRAPLRRAQDLARPRMPA